MTAPKPRPGGQLEAWAKEDAEIERQATAIVKEAAKPSTTAMATSGATVESWEDHVEAWHHFAREAEGTVWARAAIAASLRGRYGEKAVGKFAKEVGQAPAQVWRLAQVHAVFVEKSRRRENLSFTHHAEALAADDPVEALALAEREGWSVRQMREHLHPPKDLPPGDEDAEDWSCVLTIAVPHSALPRLVRALRNLGLQGGGGTSRKMRLRDLGDLRDAVAAARNAA